MDKYRMLSKKGEGTFSEVLKCQNVRDGSFWACKKMKHHFKSSEELKDIREIQALRHLSNNQNILQLHEVIFERKSGTLYLIFELMEMNLYELMKSQRTYFTHKKVANYMLQLLKAIEHMHKFGYFHRDVKPENILITDNLLKLADFGSVRRINTKHPYTEYISTRWYRAPECLLTDGFYSFPMDIWSAGCVMFEMITLRPLFPGANEIDQIDKIHDILGTPDPNLLEKFKTKSRNVRFNFKPKNGIGINGFMPSNSPREAVELIILLCTYNPDIRITAHRALKHRYFNLLREDTRENLDTQGSSRIALQAANILPVQQIDPNVNLHEIQDLYKPVYKKNPNRRVLLQKNQLNSMPIHRNSLVAISSKSNVIQPQSLSSLGHYDLSMTYNGDSRPSIDYYPTGAINSRVILPKLNTQSMDSLGYSTDPAQPLQPLVPINIQPRASIFPTVYNKALRRQSNF